jgi:homoserine O-succinyltransferase
MLRIEPVWIRLKTHVYKTSDHRHLDRFYVPFQDAVSDRPLDGMILTGAPVEHLPFEQVTYWEELSAILRFARTNIASTVGICWGGLALAKMLGIEKVVFPVKVFGMYESHNLDRTHPVTGGLDDVFFCPESRHAGIEDAVLDEAQSRGHVKCLAHAPGAGYEIFESADRRYLMHLGHPEYQAERFIAEYTRDMHKGRTDVPAPLNVDLTAPINRWRTHGAEFFGQWVRYVYESANSAPRTPRP